MTRRAVSVLLLLGLTLIPTLARAEDPPASAQTSSSRAHDPLWNGVVLGGSLGALLGAFVGIAAVDCQPCAGYNVTATFAAIGAGAGIGLGAGIDAMRGTITSGAFVKRSRVQIAPIVTKDTRAVVGRVRF
jgi:hypothetical protein